jgi:hypothetical protein
MGRHVDVIVRWGVRLDGKAFRAWKKTVSAHLAREKEGDGEKEEGDDIGDFLHEKEEGDNIGDFLHEMSNRHPWPDMLEWTLFGFLYIPRKGEESLAVYYQGEGVHVDEAGCVFSPSVAKVDMLTYCRAVCR